MPLVLERPMRLNSKKLTAFLGMRKELLPLYRLLELGVRERCGDGGEVRIEDDEIIFSDGADYLWISIPMAVKTYNPLPFLLVTFQLPYQVQGLRITGTINLERELWAHDTLVGRPEDIDEWLLDMIEKGHGFILQRTRARGAFRRYW